MAGCDKAVVWFKVICDEKKKKEMMTKTVCYRPASQSQQ